MATADAGEILVSVVTRSLAAASGYAFVGRGEHELKGFPSPAELFAVESWRSAGPRHIKSSDPAR